MFYLQTSADTCYLWYKCTYVTLVSRENLHKIYTTTEKLSLFLFVLLFTECCAGLVKKLVKHSSMKRRRKF